MKVNTFSLIEEYYPELKNLAEDTDVINKINGVVNNVSMELMPYKKISASETIKVTNRKTINLKEEIGEEFYQVKNIVGVKGYNMLDDVTMQLPEGFSGEITFYYYKYPKMVKTLFENDEERQAEDEKFEFDLDADLLHVMPYGIAADLLKMDMISGYGRYFYERYMELKNNINPRRTAGLVYAEGGVDF
jgi:hypothetical protein